MSTALKESVRHAVEAGELLIEAKGQLGHGQWLPWLQDHCTISERTAQLYMRVAKNRAEVENQIRNGAADFSLNEAIALLMLSSDVRKLLNFVKQAEGLSGEALVEFCIANNVGLIIDKSYDPLYGRSEAEKLEWLAFSLFLSCDRVAGRGGFNPEEAWYRVEYLLQRPFQNVDEWLGPEGDERRHRCGYRPIQANSSRRTGPPSETRIATPPKLTSKLSISPCALASGRTWPRERFDRTSARAV